MDGYLVVFEFNRHGCRRYGVLNGTPRRLRIEGLNPNVAIRNKPEGPAPKTAAAGRMRSAELHSAVSQICNLPAARYPQRVGMFERPAEYNSAIRQIENLRYGVVACLWQTQMTADHGGCQWGDAFLALPSPGWMSCSAPGKPPDGGWLRSLTITLAGRKISCP